MNVPAQVQQQKEQVQMVVQRARQIAVRNAADLETAVAFVREVINPRKKEAERVFNDPKTGIVSLAHQSWKAATKLRDEVLGPYEEARNIIDGKIIEFRRAEAKKAEEEAARRAEQERRDRERRIDEANKRISKLMETVADISARRVNLKAVITGADSTAEEVDAAKAALAAIEEKAWSVSEQIVDQAEKIKEIRTEPKAVVVPELSQAAGLSGYKKLRAVVVDSAALVRAIADGKVPVGIIREWDIKQLTAMLEAGMALPGVKGEEKDVVMIR